MFGVFSEQHLFKINRWEIYLMSPLAHLLEAKYLWLSELLDFSFIYWLISQKTHLTRFCAKEVENLYWCKQIFAVFQMHLLRRFCQKKSASFPLSHQDISSFVRIYKFFLKDKISLSMFWPMSDMSSCVTGLGAFLLYFPIFFFLFPYFFPQWPQVLFFLYKCSKYITEWKLGGFFFYRGSSLLSGILTTKSSDLDLGPKSEFAKP